jgi:cytoskeletal protein RodZ
MTPENIRSRRRALEISVGELAFEVRLPIRVVRDIENGKAKVPDPDAFRRAFERLERGYVIQRGTTGSES